MRQIIILLFLCSSLPVSAQVNITNGLVAYYPFSGNAKDMSGNKNDPSFNNAVLTTDKFGNPNSAYHFNGRNSYMRIRNNATLNFKKTITLAAWVRVTGFYDGKCHGNRIIMKGDREYGDGNYFMTFDDNASSRAQNCDINKVDAARQNFYGQNTSQPTGGYSPYIQINKWYAVVYTCDGTTAKLYVDCQLKGSGPQAGLTFTNNDDLFFGKTAMPDYPYWFNGDLDEVRIYNRALSAEEVTALCEKIQPVKSTEPEIDFTYVITNCNTVQFNISKSENIKSFSWDAGDKKIINARSFSKSYKAEGNYTVKLIATGTDGKQISASKSFTIAKPTTAFSIEKTVEYNTIKFTIDRKQKLKYSWLFGDGETSAKEKKVVHSYANPGEYNVMLIGVDKTGCRDTSVQVITIAAPLLPAKDSIAATGVIPVISTDTITKLPEIRQNTLLREIEVTSDSLSVTFYDNAEIDGDSVTIVYNNKIIITHLFLTAQAKTFMLPIDKTATHNELIMYAENLGSIPPNTALMIVYDGNKRHEISISSTKTNNGMVSFVFKR